MKHFEALHYARVARRDTARCEVDSAASPLPKPPAPLLPAERELLDEQAEPDPMYAPRPTSKLTQRPMALDVVTFCPLLAGAALGSELLGLTDSRLLALMTALVASLAIPVGARRLGEITAEGSLRDRRWRLFAWAGFAVLCVLLVIGATRALQIPANEYGTFAGAMGVFALALAIIGMVVLEFTQGRRAAKGTLIEGRHRVAAWQRDRRRKPPPPPEPRDLATLRARLAEVEQEVSECVRELNAKRSTVERTTHALREQAPGQASRARGVYRHRLTGNGVAMPLDIAVLAMFLAPCAGSYRQRPTVIEWIDGTGSAEGDSMRGSPRVSRPGVGEITSDGVRAGQTPTYSLPTDAKRSHRGGPTGLGPKRSCRKIGGRRQDLPGRTAARRACPREIRG